MGRVLFWSLAALMAADYVYLVFFIEPALAAEAGGLVLFDLRPGGYSPAEALAYLEALSTAGRNLYLNRWFPADMLFLLLLSLFFFFALRHLNRAQPAFIQMLGRVLTIGYAAFDIVENRRVRAMILEGALMLDEQQALIANTMTRFKFILFFALVLLLLMSLWRAWRHRASL